MQHDHDHDQSAVQPPDPAASAAACDDSACLPEAPACGAAPVAPPVFSRLGTVLGRGWRFATLRSAALADLRVPAWHLLLLLAVMLAAGLALGRLEVVGPALFYLPTVAVWAASMGVATLLSWLFVDVKTRALHRRAAAGASADADSLRTGNLLVVAYAAALPGVLLLMAFGTLVARYQGLWGTHKGAAYAMWAVGIAFMGYLAVVSYRLNAQFFGERRLAVGLTVASVCTGLAIQMALPYRFWYADEQAQADARQAQEPPRMRLSQEVFEIQQQLLDKAVEAIPRHTGATPRLYGVVYAPYGSEKVFLNESRMVTEVLENRLAARGHVVNLVNHADLTYTTPWATPRNLRAVLQAVGQRMDPERDVLLLYATSHGGKDASMASAHWPLTVGPLTAVDLAQMIKDAGIRTRVVVISACYSGSWLGALQADDALVMTAADAEHTSYGCGSQSDLTYFGRALFDELRKTASFEQAFRQAVPVIRLREEEAGKQDGFSNPQIRAGQRAGVVLAGWQATLPAPVASAATAASAPAAAAIQAAGM